MNKLRHILSVYRLPLITVFLVLLIDQFIKIYIKTHYHFGEVARLNDGVMLYFTENPGMAFGYEFGGDYGKLILSVFRIIACIVGLFYIRYIIKQGEAKGFIFAVSLILAGAVGNILDSMFYGLLFGQSSINDIAEFLPAEGGYAGFLHGHVVDMFYFPLINGHFPTWFPIWGGEEFQFFRPIFNFADAAISGGIGIIILFNKSFSKVTKPTPPVVEEQNSATSENNLNTN